MADLDLTYTPTAEERDEAMRIYRGDNRFTKASPPTFDELPRGAQAAYVERAKLTLSGQDDPYACMP